VAFLKRNFILKKPQQEIDQILKKANEVKHLSNWYKKIIRESISSGERTWSCLL